MAINENGAICDLPAWTGIPRNDTVAFINEILIAVVNVPPAIFAFLSNLAIIVAIVKTPSLQKPSNILLCSLAFTDCLTGIAAQPMFVVWRFFLQRAQRSCSHQHLMYEIYLTSHMITVGLSFSNIVIISFDRHYALSMPLQYRANVTIKGKMKTVILSSIAWFLYVICALFILPDVAGFVMQFIAGVWCIVVPVTNHIRMLIAIRRHNSNICDAVAAQQMKDLLRREKKMAIDMFVVAIILLVSVVPTFLMQICELNYPRVHAIALPWSITFTFTTSSINPVFYLKRNPDLRNAVKTVMHI